MLIKGRCPNCNIAFNVSRLRFKSLTDEYKCPTYGCPQSMSCINIIDKYFLSNSQRLMIKYDFEILLKYKHKTTLYKDLYIMLSGDTKLPDDVLEMKKYFEKNKQLTLYDIKAGE